MGEINKGQNFYICENGTDDAIRGQIFWCAKASRLSHMGSRSDDGPKDIALLSKLVKAGDEHAKSLRGVIVHVIIVAPRYWYQELATYRMGCDQLGSESTIHTQEMRYNDQVDVEAIRHIDIHKTKSNIPEGLMQERMFVMNYQALRRIYRQRRNHKLREWRWFCEWIETLPYSEELITIGIKE